MSSVERTYRDSGMEMTGTTIWELTSPGWGVHRVQGGGRLTALNRCWEIHIALLPVPLSLWEPRTQHQSPRSLSFFIYKVPGCSTLGDDLPGPGLCNSVTRPVASTVFPSSIKNIHARKYSLNVEYMEISVLSRKRIAQGFIFPHLSYIKWIRRENS